MVPPHTVTIGQGEHSFEDTLFIRTAIRDHESKVNLGWLQVCALNSNRGKGQPSSSGRYMQTRRSPHVYRHRASNVPYKLEAIQLPVVSTVAGWIDERGASQSLRRGVEIVEPLTLKVHLLWNLPWKPKSKEGTV